MVDALPLEQRLAAKAREFGFVACGVAAADAAPKTAERLQQWLREGLHGGMIWMEERAHHRESPAGLWPEVKSVIALGMSYAPATDPLALAGEGGVGRISTYAQGGDYHDVVKRALKALARWLVAEAPGIDLKVFVDTAPVMEKPLAEAAGLGWQGKHTNLVSRSEGSWLFLGAIYTTLDIAAFGSALRASPLPGATPAKAGAQERAADDQAQRALSSDNATGPRPSPGWRDGGKPADASRQKGTVDQSVPPPTDHCGSCDACQRACPTDAFPAPYRLDARRCISYLTIEHAGPIPLEFRKSIGNRIYGCDDCLAVCPWNKFAAAASANRAFLPRAELVAPELADLLALDDAGFRQVFAGSPIKRIGRDRMVRNCLIAAGNSGDPGLRAQVAELRDDPNPVVAEAADWAFAELARA